MIQRGALRIVSRVAAVLVLVALVGATFQGVATAIERRRFPRTGGMVDVGGHQLHIYCEGKGAPTVVLEAPAAGMSAAWGAVQPDIARVTRACSYDRSGLGWSESSGAPYEPGDVPRALRTLLEEANERPPFVVAGQGLGAAFAAMFAARFSGDTAALILVDPPAAGGARPEPPLLLRIPDALPWLARAGVLRASDTLAARTDGLPEPAGGALRAFLNRPDHLTRTALELSRWNDAVSMAAAAQVPSTVPVTRVQLDGSRRIGFVAGRAGAARVVTAILDAVARTRDSVEAHPRLR